MGVHGIVVTEGRLGKELMESLYIDSIGFAGQL